MQNARAWNKRLAEAVRTWTNPDGEYAEDAPRKRPAPDFSILQAYRYINRIEKELDSLGSRARSSVRRKGAPVRVP